jgi:hypothetical protein
MNEVLTKIATEAKVEHCISHVRLQNFAELIMSEFIKISQVGSITENKLKEHFGVKECN